MEDIAENLNYSFEEQCFLQIDLLKERLLEEEADNKENKFWEKQRLFRHNVFEDIEPQRKRFLERLLCYTLKSLGEHINNNLVIAGREGRSTLSTPTPVTDLSLASSISSRPRSRTRSPIPAPRSRSVSAASDLLNPVIEVIVLSSDEELDDEDEVIVKTEPEFSESFYHMSQNEVTTSSLPNSTCNNIQEQDKSSEFQVDLRLHSKPINCNTRNDNLFSRLFLVVDRRDLSNYLYDKYGVIHLKPRKYIKFSVTTQLSRQALFLHVIANVLDLIETKTYRTKRELYYKSLDFCRTTNNRKQRPSTQTQGTSGYGTQSNSQTISTQCLSQPSCSQYNTQQGSQIHSQSRSEIIKYNPAKLEIVLDDLCCLVGCSKVHLHILAQSKGIVYGNLNFKLKTGEIFDCSMKKEGTMIPTSKFPITEIKTNAKFIIVLEKDSVLQNILKQEESTNFVRDYKVILFTAKGYPDVTSRAFLNFLWSKLKIPILVLTDADPYGAEIVCSYKFGSYATAYESHLAVPHARWLGLLPGDVIRFSIPESKTLPLSQKDLKKIDSLLSRPYIKKRLDWSHQLNILRDSGRKAELESLDTSGEYLVKTYLPNKLRYASWL